MQLPSTTLFLVLFSLASAGLGEAAYKPPTTFSPDYKQCKNGVQSDPSCVPVTSDDQVAYLRSTGRRFKLLNEKRPDLKTIHASASKAAAAAASATASASNTAQMMTPGLVRPELNYPNGDGSGNDNGKSAPSYVVIQQQQQQAQDMAGKKRDSDEGSHQYSYFIVPLPEPTTTTQDEGANSGYADSASDADSMGNRKYGFGSGGWGRPYIKRDTNDFAFPAAFSGIGSYWNANAPSFPFFEPGSSGSSLGSFDAATATATATDANDIAVPASAAADAAAAVVDSPGLADMSSVTSAVSIQTQTQTQGQGQNQDSTGNAKWGFGSGGWGRPWRRDREVDGYAQDCVDSSSGENFQAQTQPQPQDQDDGSGMGADVIDLGQETGKEDTGNMKWGFGSGGWGRPFKRSILTSSTRFQRRNCAPLASENVGSTTQQSSETLLPQPIDAPSAPTYVIASPDSEGDQTGNMKWGFGSGGWGRPFARSGSAEEGQDGKDGAVQTVAPQQEEEDTDNTGDRKYGFGSGGWGRPF
ncbi:hypothetical protein IAT40_005774 [Kwoniella sp. CBS 6097]